MELLQKGYLVAGRFEIERVASMGGMAVVYRAIDHESGEPVAVKVLHDAARALAARFHREAHAVSGLRHPHLVRYVAHGFTEDHAAYLVLEWLDGSTLDMELDRRGSFGIEDATRLAARVADALSAVHAAGLVHGDLKPSEIFLREGRIDQATLIGFGHARGPDDLDVENDGMILGHPVYIAPEQIVESGQPPGPAADIHALGVVLFECLTGRRPFETTTVFALIASIALKEPPRVSELRPEVPPALDALVASLLQKSPEARPDAAAVARALAAFLDPPKTPAPA